MKFVLFAFLIISPKIFASIIDVVSFNYPPYMYEKPIGDRKGLEIEILEASLKNSNYSFNYKFYPIYRSVVETLNSKSKNTIYVGTSLHFQDQINSNQVNSVFIGRASFILYFLKDSKINKLKNINFETIKDLQIAAPLGSSIVKVLNSHNIKPFEVSQFENMFFMVESKRVDAALSLDITADEFIYNNKLNKKIKKSLNPVYQIPLAIVIKKNENSNLIFNEISSGMERIKKDGTLNLILKKYFIRSKIPSNFYQE